MISPRLKTIFAISIPLFIAHGIEEIVTGFYQVDASVQVLFAPLTSLSVHGAMFMTFQFMFWLTLVVGLLMLQSERMRLYVLGVAGVVYIFELHHIVKAVIAGGYYPGLVTALLFPPLAYFFWKEWARNYQLLKNI